MSLALTGSRIPDELVLTQQNERLRLNETHQSNSRDRSPCPPSGRIELRPNLTRCRRENLAGRRRENVTCCRSKNLAGCRGENVTSASDDDHYVSSNNNNDHCHHFRLTSANGRVSRPLHACRAGQS
jgi:hypothetical protein